MPPNDALVDAALDFSSAVLAAVSVVAVEHGLSAVQARLLGTLQTREPRMSEVADLLGLDKSSVSGLVARAKSKGLVRRVEDGQDRRSSRVTLTDAGRAVASRLAGDVAERVSPMESGFSTAGLALFVESLTDATIALRPAILAASQES